MSTPEGRVKAMIKRRMEAAFGDYAYRFMPVQNGMGAPALDFYYCVYGLFVAIEAKVKGKKPTPRQETTAEQITKAGGLALVVDDEQSMEAALLKIRTRIRYAD